MKTIALHSSKGGVGKTSAAVNLAYLASKEGLRILLVDLDPQGSSSFLFRMEPVKGFGGQDLIKGKERSLHEGIRASDYEHLDLIPAALSFRKLESLLADKGSGKTKGSLKKPLSLLFGSYDLIVLDCPPGISALAEAIYEASDMILCPAIATPLSQMSLKRLEDFIRKRELEPAKLRVFISLFEPRKSVQANAALELERSGFALMKAKVPYSADVERMGSLREPICVSKPGGKASLAFKELWREAKDILFA